MVRMELAKRAGYDVDCRVGEDADFFARCLAGRAYRQVSTPVYCYREFASFSRAGLWAGLAADRDRRLRRVTGTARVAAVWASWWVKRVLYASALGLFGPDWVLRRRCRPMTPDERAAFEHGSGRVLETLGRIKEKMN